MEILLNLHLEEENLEGFVQVIGFKLQQLLPFGVIKFAVDDKLSSVLLRGQCSCLVVVHQKAV